MARERRLTFGEVADLYDEVRPSYPPEMVDDIIGLAPFERPPRRALEVGAGTGKATILFAERDVSVHAVEPSAQMAVLAERNLGRFDDITIESVDFEAWDPRGETFPLIYAAQAWHWISPDTGYVKARSALRDDGVLAAFWNRADWEGSPLRADLIEVYRRVAPERTGDDPMHPAAGSEPDWWDEWEHAIDITAGLDAPELRNYRWTCDYATSDYLALLSTHSPNIVLPDAQRAELLAGISRVLDEHGGTFTMNYITRLYLARAR